ncbi:hypothetical protein GCM10009733_065660 [Nonomuraea maheshkhaliensis]|uniref:Uncharacterized protein n=1 Tax=Nonomuraea maheshkhaliensis TaxID=419590 RepID=A0ABN2FU17_9ACTN
MVDDQKLPVGAGDGELVALQLQIAGLRMAEPGDLRLAAAYAVASPQRAEPVALERQLAYERRQARIVVARPQGGAELGDDARRGLRPVPVRLPVPVGRGRPRAAG